MSRAEVLTGSRAIASKIMAMDAVVKADTIFSYNAIGNEVILDPIHLNGWRVALPQVINDKEMIFRLVGNETVYKKSPYGIYEPDTGEVVTPTAQSVILVPASVYTAKGDRLGYGGGYYDRYMAAYPCLRIGVAYSHQMTDAIPTDYYDIPVDFVVTD